MDVAGKVEEYIGSFQGIQCKGTGWDMDGT